MEQSEVLIRGEHPPHLWTDIKNRLPLSRILRKVALFVIMFTLSFHFPIFIPGLSLSQREQTVKDILEVLERQPMGLADVTKEELAEVIYEEASRHNQDPKFILALIAIESEFKNWSVSEQGAKGLLQLMPYVAKSVAHELGIEWSGDRTLFNPYLNVRIGTYYLSQLILDFNDIQVALTAYNYGPTYVKGLIEKNETIPHDYYKKFLAVYQNI